MHALAADVAEDDEGGTRGKEGDLEEVAAEFLRGQVDAGDGLSGDEGRVSGMRICWTVRAASRSAAARCSSRVTRTKRQRTTARMAMKRMKVAKVDRVFDGDTDKVRELVNKWIDEAKRHYDVGEKAGHR